MDVGWFNCYSLQEQNGNIKQHCSESIIDGASRVMISKCRSLSGLEATHKQFRSYLDEREKILNSMRAVNQMEEVDGVRKKNPLGRGNCWIYFL